MESNIQNESHFYAFEGFSLDASKRLVFDPKGETLPLMPKAYEILLYLVRNPERVVEKDELMSAVWPDTVVEENNLTQNISALRRVLGEKHRENRFIATVPGRGYKFVARVNRAPLAADEDITDVQPKRDTEPRSRSSHWWAVAVAVLLLAIAGGVTWRVRSGSGSEEIRSVAVLPFKPLASDRRDESLELGMADTLIMKLGSGDNVSVRPLSAVRRFTELDQDPIDAGRAVNVDAVLDGSIQIVNDRIRVSVKLLRVTDSKQLWSGQFDEQLTDIFAVQDSIAQRVASALNMTLGKEAVKAPTQSVEAYQLYMRGNLHARRLIRTEVEKGIGYYLEAIKVDPKFALAYADLSNAYRALVLTSDYLPDEYMPKAKDAAEKAIQFDDTLAEAFSARAFVAFWYDWDWKASEKDYLHALDLNPYSSQSRLLYGHLLSNLGRHDEALRQMRMARERDPASLLANALEGQALFYAGRTDEAQRALAQTLDLDPNFWLASLFMTRVHLRNQNYEQAISAARKAADVSGGNSEALATIGFAEARAGRPDEARKIIADLEGRLKTRFVPAYNFAIIYAGLRDRSKALEYLEKAYSERDAPMVFLKIEPKWDELRNEPRFIALMKRMNFD